MTNLEKIKSLIKYSMETNEFKGALEDRGLRYTATYGIVTDKQAMDLTRADLFVLLVTTPSSVSESGYSVSLSDKELLKNMAADTYAQYGLPNPFAGKKPSVTGVKRW